MIKDKVKIRIAFGVGNEFAFISGHGFYKKTKLESFGELVKLPKLDFLNNLVKNTDFSPKIIDLDDKYYAEMVIENWENYHWEIKEKEGEK